MPAKVCFALILAGICVIVVPLYKRSVTLALLNMRIANPIYDVVFKYLMDDNKIARLIISSIINEEIEELELRPLEVSGNLQQNEKKTENSGDQETPPVSLSLTVYRLDFSAKIRTPQGIKTVIIEIQKTKFPTDNLRFRKYLSSQYASNENAHKVLTGGRLRTTGIPIISIYFLGHKLDATTACAIGVKRVYVDLITNEPIQQKEVFIESLTHDSYIIQIPFLTPQRRNDLEILLSVFDQSKAIDARRHILNIKEEEFPEKFRPIIRKLQKAIQNKQVKQKMDMEDTLIDELTEMELTIRKLEAENKLAKLLIEQERQQNEAAQLLIEQERQQIEAAGGKSGRHRAPHLLTGGAIRGNSYGTESVTE
ncbi:hypothetical protein C7N43_06685, partial [Sphingobacteriales bacterium UPWRP_1]